jgi:hypothetical protein
MNSEQQGWLQQTFDALNKTYLAKAKSLCIAIITRAI